MSNEELLQILVEETEKIDDKDSLMQMDEAGFWQLVEKLVLSDN